MGGQRGAQATEAFREAIGVDPAQFSALIAAGKTFVARFDAIEETARLEIVRKFGAPAPVELEKQLPNGGTSPAVFLKVPPQGLRAELERLGILKAVDDEKATALREFKEVVIAATDSQAWQKAEDWTMRNIRPGIVVSDGRVPRPNLPSNPATAQRWVPASQARPQ